jgi:hypothetical protein
MVMGGSYSNLYRILYACYERFDDIKEFLGGSHC